MQNEDDLIALAKQPFEDKRNRSIWMQIYDRLTGAIGAGLLTEGSKLPGEDDLAKMFGVNRITLRKALSRLQREGRLVSRKGVGVFVRHLAMRYVVHQNYAGNASIDEATSPVQTLSLERKSVSPDAAKVFGLPQEAEIVELRMLQFAKEVPYYYAVKEFPLCVFPDFIADYEREGTILGAYEAAGIKQYIRSETRIFGDFATDEEANLLQISNKAPLLRSRSFNNDTAGRIIEYNRGCWPMMGVELVFNNNFQAPESINL